MKLRIGFRCLAVCSGRCQPGSCGRLSAPEPKALERLGVLGWMREWHRTQDREGPAECNACLLLESPSSVEKHPAIFLWRKPGIFQLQNSSLEAPGRWVPDEKERRGQEEAWALTKGAGGWPESPTPYPLVFLQASEASVRRNG